MKKTIITLLKIIKYPNRYNSKRFIKYLRKHGTKVGNGTHFFAPENTYIDTNNGIFIEIGAYCKITTGVRILAHDYSYSVLRRVYHNIPKKASLTKIGDNCFIGVNSIILSGSKIGNNVIIGAGSVVSGKIPDNQVWAGNPARFICSLDDYYKKCKAKFEDNCKLTIQRYLEINNRIPTVQELQYFSLLFLNKDKNYNNTNEYQKMMFSGDNKKEVLNDCLCYKSKYNSYEELLKSFGIQEKIKEATECQE